MTVASKPRLALTTMIVLTFVTGVVDAVGYLGLDKVFTGNMTGNIVILGMGVAGADGLPILGPALALAGFTAGAWAAGIALRSRDGKGWDHRITVLLTLGGLALAAMAVLAAVATPAAGHTTGTAVQIVLATVTAAVMGQQAMTARAVAVADMTTVVVTSTLAGLAGETWTRAGSSTLFNRRLAAILIIFAGAVVGALLLKVHIAVPFALAAALTFAVVLAGHLHLNEARSRAKQQAVHLTS